MLVLVDDDDDNDGDSATMNNGPHTCSCSIDLDSREIQKKGDLPAFSQAAKRNRKICTST